MRWFVLCLALLSPTMAAAQSSPDPCSRLTASYEAHERRLALNFAEANLPTRSEGEQRLLMQATELDVSFLQTTLLLMGANHCPAPARPLNAEAYMRAMRACIATAPGQGSQACNRATWMPDPPQ